MTPYKARRIRFGILAARHYIERDRLTPQQVDYLETCGDEGWRVRDSRRAFKREYDAARVRKAEAK